MGGRVKSKTEKLAPVASPVSIYHLRSRTGLVDPVSVSSDWMGYRVYLWHGTTVCKSEINRLYVHRS